MPNRTFDATDIVTTDYHRGSDDVAPVGNDVVAYHEDDVGNFSSNGDYVLLSNRDGFGLWDVARFSSVERPARFERSRGIWIASRYVRDSFLEQRLLESPEYTLNKPLTALSADNE